MKNKFKFYAAAWAILLAVFNVICFVTPNETAGLSKFGGTFWVGYIFITVAFVGQLLCAVFAFRTTEAKKLFYSLSLVTISYSGLILTVIAGSVCMIFPNLPNWVGIIACLLILAFNAIAVIKAAAAKSAAEETEEKVAEKTDFMKKLTAKAEILYETSGKPEIKEECKKLYEEIKYSDPVSTPALSEIEKTAAEKTDMLSAAAKDGDVEKVKTLSAEVIAIIKERNALCKAEKRG